MNSTTLWTRRLIKAMERAQPVVADPRSLGSLIPAQAIRQALLHDPGKRDPLGLRVYGFEIEGYLGLDNINVGVNLEFVGCRFDSDISIYGIQVPTLYFGSCELQALMGNAAKITGNFNVIDCVFNGLVTCLGVEVGGQFGFAHTRILAAETPSEDKGVDESARQPALTLDRTKVTGILLLNAVEAGGPVSCTAVEAGSIQATNMRISAADSLALSFEGCVVSQGIALDGSNIVGQLSLNGLKADSAHLVSVTVTNAPSVAINLEHCQIRENIYLMGAQCSGELSVNGTTVAQLRLEGSRLLNPEGAFALTAEHLRATAVLLRDMHVEGYCDFAAADVAHFMVDLDVPQQASFAPVIDLIGASFTEVSGYPMTGRVEAVAWLERRPQSQSKDFISQPWQKMAEVLDRHGRPEDARWLRWQAARRSAQASRGIAWLSRNLYGLLAGHGYYAGRRALVSLIILFVATFTVTVTSDAHFRPSGSDLRTSHPSISGATACGDLDKAISCFNPALYALETVFPTAGNVQTSAWSAEGTIRGVVFSFARLMGWVLTALLLAAVTGILKKT